MRFSTFRKQHSGLTELQLLGRLFDQTIRADEYEKVALEWMNKFDELKEKYEPTELTHD